MLLCVSNLHAMNNHEEDSDDDFLVPELIRNCPEYLATIDDAKKGNLMQFPTIDQVTRIAYVYIMNENNELLLGKEADDEWNCPIVPVDGINELRGQALKNFTKRQILQEFGITINHLTCRNQILNNVAIGADIYPYCIYVYRAKNVIGNLTLSQPHRFNELRWFSKEELIRSEIFRGHGISLQEFDRPYKDDAR